MIRSAACLLVLATVTVAGAAETGQSAYSTITDAKGRPVGTATFSERKGGVEVKVEVAGLPPGKHGFHLHDKGICQPPAFTTAGDHFNPLGKHHGAKNPEGRHAGDLPNLEVGPDGTAELTATAEGATLGKGPDSLLKEGGTSLVIHAGPDDEKSDPSGNSGPRIACGVVVAK